MTNEQHKEVIKMHNQGKTTKQIAEYFGVNKNSIRSIIKKHEVNKK